MPVITPVPCGIKYEREISKKASQIAWKGLGAAYTFLAGRVPSGLSTKKTSRVLGPPWPFASPFSFGMGRRSGVLVSSPLSPIVDSTISKGQKKFHLL